MIEAIDCEYCDGLGRDDDTGEYCVYCDGDGAFCEDCGDPLSLCYCDEEE